MGIRYYAYAFDRDQTRKAVADPHTVLSDDPLADAWGLEPHAAVSVTTFEQSVPERDLLYLDKAWRHLQIITGPAVGEVTRRPAFAMFEGEVTMHGMGWEPWVRTLTPDDVVDIARDLALLSDEQARAALSGFTRFGDDEAGETAYALQYLAAARRFVQRLVEEDRGMVYMIG